jgi:hypothetical protein
MQVLVATTANRDQKSRGPSVVGAAIDGRVNFELASRGSLDSICHRLWDHFIPLRDGTARDSNGPGDGRPVPVEVRKHIRLKHAEQGTAC